MNIKFNADFKRWLKTSYDPLQIEREIRSFWDENGTLEKLTQSRSKNNTGILGYVEGPPTLNGIPHVGHARGRVMKDLRFRWKTMEGYYIPFWAGWDCQGLPVELEVEQRLGVKSKKDVFNTIGVERFIEECKKTIKKYHREWFNADKKLGVFISQDKAYWTFLDAYIEREWMILKKAWEQGLMGEGYYVVAYCPGCQTSLSSAEVGYEGAYRMVEDPSVYFKFKLEKSEDTYFLVWTTMPFTIITDMMVAVHPEAEYAKVKVGQETWILTKQRVKPVMEKLGISRYEVTESMKGSSLRGTKYEYPLQHLIPKQAELHKQQTVHTAVCEEFVDVETATGVVHLAPGNGEDDFHAAQKREIKIFVPFNDECRFTEEAGAFTGLFARDADEKVIGELRKLGLLVSSETVTHEYPTCWRSHHRLIWLARREYFIWTNKLNNEVVEAAKKVRYFFEQPKNRFLAFLMEGKPWCISRERVWGTPLPIWVCEECNAKTLVESKKELVKKASNKLEPGFELHRPWVDRVTLKCGECGGPMKREPFVLDTWHNSGAAPYARFTDEEYEEYVPADFLTEAVDQTRGWANSLLLEHVILSGKAEAPYKAFLFQGFALDAKGRKMSKSLGNIIEVNSLLEKHSADLCRLYMMWKCSPIDSMNFDVNELNRRPFQILSTLYHLHRFFLQNAEYDNFNPVEHTLESTADAQEPPERWLISKTEETVSKTTKHLEACQFNSAASELEHFLLDLLSHQYVPMIRKDLWNDSAETRSRRIAVYTALWHALKTLTQLFNPLTPYISEYMHQNVYRKLDQTLPPSVNLEPWPKPREEWKDPALEQQFETLFKTVSLTLNARQSAKLKRRWPLQTVAVAADEKTRKTLKKHEHHLRELANVENVVYSEETSEYKGERWASASEDNIHIFLDTRRTQKLLGKGYMRDLARRVQNLRKEMGYTPTDILDEVHIAEEDPETRKLLAPHLTEMTTLVRTKKVRLHSSTSAVQTEWRKYVLDKKAIYVAILMK